MKPPVLTKLDFVDRYLNGEFGNASPSWHSIGDFTDTCFTTKLGGNPVNCEYHLRNRVAGGSTFYNLTRSQVICYWYANRCFRGGWYISEMAPTELTLIQGEVMRAPWGLYLHGSIIPRPMRDALRLSSFHINGLRAYTTLKSYLCPRSYEWLWYLLEEYPDHVVEFSTYGIDWGTIPGFNTVFWEVRRY